VAKGTVETYNQIAWQHVSDAAKAVTSADAFYALYRETEYYVPRTVARRVWGMARLQPDWAGTLAARDPNLPVYRSVIDYEDFGFRAKYATVVELTYTDPETGDVITQKPLLLSSQLPSLAAIGIAAGNAIDKYVPEDTDRATISYEIKGYLGNYRWLQ